MLHGKYYRMRVFPWNSERSPEQVNRVQEATGDLTLNREKRYELGRVGLLGYRKGTPSFPYTLRQYENGDMSFFRALANKEDPATASEDNTIDLDDLSTTKSDIAAFLTEEDGVTFAGTVIIPRLRVTGFSINIGNPDAEIERNISLIGEDYKVFDGKYFAYYTDDVATGEETKVITFGGTGEPIVPIAYETDTFIFRVLRIRDTEVFELTEGTGDDEWQYSDASKELTIADCGVGDTIKVYYCSDEAYDTLWENEDVQEDFLLAEDCEIFIKINATGHSEARVYRLQSIGIDVTLERTDYKEIGNSEVVQTGVKAKTVKVSLDRFAEDFSLEDILQDDNSNILIDPRKFSENIELLVKVYKEKTHENFKIAFKITDLTPMTTNIAQKVEEYQSRTTTLESDNISISDDSTELFL